MVVVLFHGRAQRLALLKVHPECGMNGHTITSHSATFRPETAGAHGSQFSLPALSDRLPLPIQSGRHEHSLGYWGCLCRVQERQRQLSQREDCADSVWDVDIGIKDRLTAVGMMGGIRDAGEILIK